MDKALVLAKALQEVKSRVAALEDTTSVITKLEGPQGPKGVDGKAGRDGKDGLNGRDGVDGKDGIDGKQGKDGKDGVSIVDVYWAADGSLTCVLSNGREIDTGPLLDTQNKGQGSVNISNWAGYSAEELKQSLIANTFETVNKNLSASNGHLTYNVNDDLISIEYANGITKTLAYDVNNDLGSVTLSGNTPEGIDLVKTFSYDAFANLTDFTYS